MTEAFKAISCPLIATLAILYQVLNNFSILLIARLNFIWEYFFKCIAQFLAVLRTKSSNYDIL